MCEPAATSSPTNLYEPKGAVMQHTIIATAVLLGAMLSAQASPAHHHIRGHHTRYRDSGAVTYDRDSRDPGVGWHWRNGERVCTQDCDNPEIPGSGYTCRNIQLMGMDWPECTRTN
jgi:hypothetical protein